MTGYQSYNGSGLMIPNRLAQSMREPDYRGDFVIHHADTFVARYGIAGKTYLNPDEAYIRNRSLQRAMLLDPVITEPLFARIMAVALLDWSIAPEDDDDQIQRDVCKRLERTVKRIPRFVRMKFALLMAIWYGRYAIENVWKWGWDTPSLKPCLDVADWIPILGDKLRTDDDNRLGVQIRTATGSPSAYYGDEAPIRFLNEEERDAFVFHQHMVLDGDFFDPRAAGSHMGLGLRHFVWWPWFFKQNIGASITEFAGRVGTGVTLWFFERDNDASYRSVKEAAEKNQAGANILFPRGPEGKTRGEGVERMEIGTGGGQFLFDMLDKYWGEQIKRLIAGQTLTSDTGATGLGSNVAEQHANTKAQYQRFDAMNLDETLSRDLLGPMLKYPGGFDYTWRPQYRSTLQSPDPAKVMQAARQLYEMDAEIPEQHLRDVAGIPKPKTGERTLRKAKASANPLEQQGLPFGGEGEIAGSAQ